MHHNGYQAMEYRLVQLTGENARLRKQLDLASRNDSRVFKALWREINGLREKVRELSAIPGWLRRVLKWMGLVTT
jgi:hypothetical protein